MSERTDSSVVINEIIVPLEGPAEIPLAHRRRDGTPRSAVCDLEVWRDLRAQFRARGLELPASCRPSYVPPMQGEVWLTDRVYFYVHEKDHAATPYAYWRRLMSQPFDSAEDAAEWIQDNGGFWPTPNIERSVSRQRDHYVKIVADDRIPEGEIRVAPEPRPKRLKAQPSMSRYIVQRLDSKRNKWEDWLNGEMLEDVANENADYWRSISDDQFRVIARRVKRENN